MQTLQRKQLNNLIEPLNIFGTYRFTVKPGYESTPLAYLEGNNDLIANQWYQLQSAILNAVKLPFAADIINIISRFNNFEVTNKAIHGDGVAYTPVQQGQFPPDLLKTSRLVSTISFCQPDLIVEIGCGTSSAVISHYLSSSLNKKTKLAWTVDRGVEWSNLTQKKIREIMSLPDMHIFLQSQNNKATVESLATNIRNHENIFIYLDAVVLESDRRQGLDLILQCLKFYEGEVTLMIDARYKAVQSLHSLCDVIQRDLAVTTSVLLTKKGQGLEGVSKLQRMGSFTLAVTKS